MGYDDALGDPSQSQPTDDGTTGDGTSGASPAPYQPPPPAPGPPVPASPGWGPPVQLGFTGTTVDPATTYVDGGLAAQLGTAYPPAGSYAVNKPASLVTSSSILQKMATLTGDNIVTIEWRPSKDVMWDWKQPTTGPAKIVKLYNVTADQVQALFQMWQDLVKAQTEGMNCLIDPQACTPIDDPIQGTGFICTPACGEYAFRVITT